MGRGPRRQAPSSLQGLLTAQLWAPHRPPRPLSLKCRDTANKGPRLASESQDEGRPRRVGTCTGSLTQHALGVPGVLVPGLDTVLHGPGDLVEVHVLHGAVHAAAVVGLPRRGGPHHISHLGQGGGGEVRKPLGQNGAVPWALGMWDTGTFTSYRPGCSGGSERERPMSTQRRSCWRGVCLQRGGGNWGQGCWPLGGLRSQGLG